MHSGKHANQNPTAPRHEPAGPTSGASLPGASLPGASLPGASLPANATRVGGVPIENPHELLGLVAGEENTRVIIEAARTRLSRIRAANGSEAAVRAFVIGQICRARAAMLKEARRRAGRRERAGVRRTPGTTADSADTPCRTTTAR